MGAGPTILMAHTGGEDPGIERGVFDGLDATLVTVAHLGAAEALAVMPEANAVMVTTQPVGADLLALLGRCRIVTRIGTGIDAIDLETAAARGVWVTNVPDYSIDEVSSHALALLMSLQRNLRGHEAAARAGDWRYQSVSPIRRLSDLTLGILGFGRIGRAMGRKGAGIGMRVIVHDPYIPEERIREAGAEPVDFETLLGESDYLSLHVPLTPDTRGKINADALAKMKPTAYVVNTARGEVVDIPALVAVVQAGELAGAGIDVLPTEPPDPNDPVLHEPRILVTPHVAWASEQSKVDVRQRGAEDVRRVLSGERPRYPVNQPVATGVAAD